MQDQLWNAGPVKITTKGSKYGSQSGPCREPGCAKRALPKQGARYCEEHARSKNYGSIQTDNATFKTDAICLGCSNTFKRWRQTRATSITFDICPDCIRNSPLTIKQLQSHRVPYDLARKWLAHGKELDCELCGRRLYRKSRSAGPTVDHNHTCCPGSTSCGSCIRGIICGRCNTCLAHVERLLNEIGVAPTLAWIQR